MSTTTSYNKTTWEQVMAMKSKDTRHKGVANTLKKDEIETILAVVDFFNGNWQQVGFDLVKARFRVFDALAMYVGGRLEPEPTKVLVHSFLKVDGNIDKWIEDLRVSDYQVDTSYQAVAIEN
jgi:hypothetical protein